MPTEAEVALARRIIDANAEAEKVGRASFELDGKMIDVPVVQRARALLARHEAIAARG